MLNFAHSGGAGDVLYSLYSVKLLCELHNTTANFYLKRSNCFNNTVDCYETLRRLLLHQSYTNEVYVVPESPFGVWELNCEYYDLDKFRLYADTKTNLVYCHLKALQLESYYESSFVENWLRLPRNEEPSGDYVVVNKTPRYTSHNSTALWSHTLQKYSAYKKYFVGLQQEYSSFCEVFPQYEVQHYSVVDLYDVGALVSGAVVTLCNPSSTLALCLASGSLTEVELDEQWSPVVGTKKQNQRSMCSD